VAPEVSYAVTGSTGELRVQQPSMMEAIGLSQQQYHQPLGLSFNREIAAGNDH
jgi:hypothetical protein